MALGRRWIDRELKELNIICASICSGHRGDPHPRAADLAYQAFSKYPALGVAHKDSFFLGTYG